MNNKLFISFEIAFDEAFQQTTVNMQFHNVPPANSHIDVSFLIDKTIAEPEKEGILLDMDGNVKLSDMEDCIDRWPNDGDWFYTWEDLEDEYHEKWSRTPYNEQESDDDDDEESDED
jgi:hypothetical protein